MLRFDIPQVWSNVIRWEAFLTTVVSVLAALVSPWLMALLAVQGAVRGLAGHHRCPAHRLWKRLFEHWHCQGRKEDAGAKMFANKILLLASTVAVGLYASGSDLWIVPVVALIVFSTLEWALSFCAACWVYGAWYRRFPPAGA
jgi:hypothetical protein